MISVEEALERILSFVHVLEAEERPLMEALGQTLAEDVTSPIDVPPLDNTAMDGYAVRAADTRGAAAGRGVTLRVVGQVAAGYLAEQAVGEGEAVRIMTGAPVPPGADAIVPFEETDEAEPRAYGATPRATETVTVYKAARPGANVRRAAEDVRRGDMVVPTGTVLRPAQVGVIASLGRASVRVIRRPAVAVLSTGDELLEPGQAPEAGKIYDSNEYAVAAMVTEAGAVPRMLGIARDTPEALTAKIREGLSADMLVTSAGVSRGDYDVVKDVLAKEGRVDFWTVRMKPGKPLAFGTFTSPDGRQVPHLGLPGNPVSSMVSFELFGRPAIHKMMGRPAPERRVVQAVCREAIENHDGRRVFARAIVRREGDGYTASLTGPQGSGILTSMALANALVIVPEDRPGLQPGEEATAILLE